MGKDMGCIARVYHAGVVNTRCGLPTHKDRRCKAHQLPITLADTDAAWFKRISGVISKMPRHAATLRHQQKTCALTFAGALAGEFPKFDPQVFLSDCFQLKYEVAE